MDQLYWFLYLGSVAVISFLNESYLSQQWLTFSAFFYGFIAVYCLTLLFGGQCNSKALHNARYVLGIYLVTLLWLWLQSVVPIDNHLYEKVFFNADVPTWFQPDKTWSVVPDKTRWLFFSNLLVFAIFVISLCLINSRRRVKQLLVLFVVVGFTHALIGVLAQYANVQLVSLEEIDGHYDVARAWFVNRNHFASFICLCLIGSLSFQLKESMNVDAGRIKTHLLNQMMSARILILISLLLSVLAIILSQSRAGFLSMTLATLMLMFLFRRELGGSGSRWWVLILIGIGVIGLLVYFGNELLARFYYGKLDFGERFDQWLITWHAITQQFFLGYGGGSYATVFQVFREYAELRQVLYDQAHNEYLHIWLEQGLIGLLLWLGFLSLSIQRAWLSIKNHRSRLVVALSCAGLTVVVAALMQSLVGYNLQIINIRSYFFVIIALLFSAPKIKQ